MCFFKSLHIVVGFGALMFQME